MAVRKIALSILFVSVWLGLAAQDAAPTAAAPFRSLTPADQWELGVDLGVPFVSGDLNAKPGFGGGLHLRKSLDHIFSVRINGLYAQAKGEGEGGADTRTSDTRWISGGGQLVIAANNIRFDKPNRKILFNLFGGLGVQNFSTDYTNIPGLTDGTVDGTNAYFDIGAGLAFRFSPRFNLGVEYTVLANLGGQADLLDGDENRNNNVTTFRDFLHFPHLSLNFNLGGTDKKTGAKKSEPLYWTNPMSEVSNAISALEARPIYDPTDTDSDGIIDAIDEEDNSPAGARVDTRGVTLDSDGDKVADYKDKEPYSPPGYPVDAMGVANVPKPNWVTEADVNRIVDAKLANFKLPVIKSVNDWFLPMVNFDLGSYKVKQSEYGKLYQVAQAVKANPEMRFAVTGYTDASGSEGKNDVLSYNRSKAVVDFLTTQHGISRDRLVLLFGGETNAIVPAKGANATNRRAEFKVAKDEKEATPPAEPDAKGRMKGNKDAGF